LRAGRTRLSDFGASTVVFPSCINQPISGIFARASSDVYRLNASRRNNKLSKRIALYETSLHQSPEHLGA